MKLNFLTALLTISSFLLGNVLFADGTRQASPTNSADGAALLVAPDIAYGSYLGCGNEQRIRFTVVNDVTENLYLGFQTRDYNNGGSAIINNVYYRIYNAAGVQVAGPILIPTTGAGFINTYAEAFAGPNIGGATPTGYNPLVFDPTSAGDHYIEIYRSNDGGATMDASVAGRVTMPFFDMTVSTTANVQSIGRVWSRRWAFVTTNLTSGLFEQALASSFTGDYFAYTPDQFIIQVQFQPGFRPLAYEIAMNFNGATNSGNFINDRRSQNTTVPLNNGYQVFLSNPDLVAFPTGITGNPAFTSNIFGCPGNYFIPYVIDQPGDVSIIIDLNGTPGYQAGTEDVSLEAYGLAAGNHVMAWNGQNGLGAALPPNFNVQVQVTLYQGRTNIPMNDAELNSNGLSVIAIFPATGGRRLYWDDTSILPFGTCATQTENISTGGVQGVVLANGILGPTHAWDGSNPNATVPAPISGQGSSTIGTLCDDYGNARCMNTWFYAIDLSSPLTTMTLPSCDLDSDGIADNTDLDDDNDGILDNTENGGLPDATADADLDGIPNYIDPSAAGFVDVNMNGVDDRYDFDGDGTINSFDLDSDNDGIVDLIETGQVDANSNGQIDGYVDANNNGVSDAVDPACNGSTVTGQASANAGTAGGNANPGNIVDGSNVTFGTLTGNPASIDLDFGQLLPTGTVVTIRMSSAVAGAATGNFTRSADDVTYAQTQAYSVTTTTLQNVTYTLTAPARYVRVQTSSGNDTRIAIATFSFVVCNGTIGTAIVPVNTDGNGGANYLDIDADNDGIVDNSEAQSTAGYIAPTGTDTDNDGIDNAYDAFVGFGGAGTTPVNTDGADTPDYIDLNSDNDALTDAIEGWDTNLDGTANTTPLGTDADNDGLDDAYDVNDALVNPTNGTTPTSYPNLNAPGTTERDWREVIVSPTVTLTGTTTIAENVVGTVTLTATLSNPVPTATTVTLTYTGTAVGADYTSSSVTIFIPAGSLTGTVTIDPTDDAISEPSETVIADITSVSGGNGATENGVQTATVTITDNDAPTVTLSGTTTVAETAGAQTITATLSNVATTNTIVTVTLSGTATSGADYPAVTTTMTILAGSLTGTTTVDPTDDAISEPSETVIFDITSVTGGNGATESGVQTATVTITDNDAPTVTLSGTSTVAETAGAQTITATLSNVATTDVTVTVTLSGTATSGADYPAVTTTITILAGSLTGTTTVDPTDDAISEPTETVIFDITSVTGGNGANENGVQTATVTITDNDAPTVTLSGTTTIAENAVGTVTLTATLSNVATTATTVTLTYTGTAAGTDYAASSITITIPAGSLTGTVTIDPTDDALVEGNETVIADITAVAGGNGATESGVQTATVTILDDDAPTVTLSGTTTIAENLVGTTTLTATLSQVALTDVVVTLNYTGTAVGADYTASSTTITILAGQLTGTVTIDPTDDAISEPSETVIADITSVTGGNGATENGVQTATVTITDNDAPTVTLTGTTTIAENAVGTTTLTATLSNVATTDVTVTLTYTGTAVGSDYVASSTTITIPAGSTTGTVTIDPTDDIVIEGDETVIADITSVSGGNGATESGTQTATVTIIENDVPPVANDDIVVTPIAEDGPNGTVSILTNDTDGNGNPTAPTNGPGLFTVDLDPLTAGIQTTNTTTEGVWTYNPITGVVTFDPATNYNGTATITYQLCDPGNACDNAIITFTVSPVNDAPIVDNEIITTPEETPVSGDLTNGGDSDPDGTPLVVTTTPVDGPNNGTIVINTDGTFTYTPNPNFNGNDTVIVSVCDSGTPLPAICVNDTIFITVTPVNDAPVVDNEIITTPEETPVSGDLTNGGDTDPDGTPLVVTTTPVDGPNNGTIVINTDGTFTYTPNPNFNGNDTVIVSVCDSGIPLPAICVNDTIFITVTPVNDATIVDNEIITTPEETPV
ncbi:MAG: tandem-95 repeat protein [Fluviicola sp.]